MILKVLGGVVAVLLLVWAGWFAYLSYSARPPEVRLQDGRLRLCPLTPNCVSSESSEPQSRIEPLRFRGPAPKAWADLAASIRALNGTVVEQQDGFLWATFTSRIFRFVDDMEFRLEAEQGLIQLRSGSRVGKSDMGVNRERVERLRKLFEQRQGKR